MNMGYVQLRHDRAIRAGDVGGERQWHGRQSGEAAQLVLVFSDLMNNSNTGHLTLTLPQSMLVAWSDRRWHADGLHPGAAHLHARVWFVLLPMAMVVSFLVVASFTINMCVVSLMVFAWHKLDGKKAALLVPAVASRLICGDGI
jgi:hypothetical protein